MTLDLREFFQATNPDKTLFVNNTAKDQNYYIDFSPVRGGHVIKELSNQIAFWSPDTPTCQLFTGHVGCGKSTELLQLKAQLEREGFHIVYFESSKNLEMADVDVSDILLAIAARVSQSLDRMERDCSQNPKAILKQVAKLLQTEIELTAEASVPGLGDVAASTEGDFSVDVGIPGVGKVKVSQEEWLSFVAPLIGKITAKAKASPEFRNKLRGYLEPRTNGILEAINSELIEPGIKRLKDDGKKGLVVIVDNLDRIDSSVKPWGRNQQEYLFVDRGEQLRSLNCHLIYTMPLALRFSNEFGPLTQRFKNPTVLPKVILNYKNALKLAVDDHEWALLHRVAKDKKVTGDDGYEKLIRSMFVYEYQDRQGSWFMINPVLAEAEEFQS